MRCFEVKDLLEEHIFGEVDETRAEEIDSHISVCPDCSSEYNALKDSIYRIEVDYKGINIPDKLDKISIDVKNPGTKVFSLKKLGLIAACFMVVFSISAFTPIFAAIQENVSDIIKYFALGDKGIVKSIENGFGQTIEKSSVDSDVKFTVHNLVADANRTEILFSIEYEGEEEFDGISLPFSGMELKNQFGSKVKSSSFGYSMRGAENRLTGRYSTDPLGLFDKWVTLGFDEISLTKLDSRKVDFDLKQGTRRNLNMDIPVESSLVKGIVLKDIVLGEDTIAMDYNIQMNSEEYGGLRPRLVLWTEDGNKAFMEYSELHTNEESNVDRARDVFDLKGSNIENVKMGVEYYDIVKTIKGDWHVTFRPNMSRARNQTIKVDINKSFEISGHEFKIREACFTPSQTQVYVEKVGYHHGMVQLMDMGIMSNNEFLHRNTSDSGGMNTTIYKFDPVEDFSDIRFVIRGVEVMDDIDEEILLDKVEGSGEWNVQLNGFNTKMKYTVLGDNGLEVAFEHEDENLRGINGAYILTDDGERLFCSDIDFPAPYGHNLNRNRKTVLKFRDLDLKGDIIKLHVTAVSEYKDVSIEIPIK